MLPFLTSFRELIGYEHLSKLCLEKDTHLTNHSKLLKHNIWMGADYIWVEQVHLFSRIICVSFYLNISIGVLKKIM